MKYPFKCLLVLFCLLFSCQSKVETELFPDAITFNIEDAEHFHLTGGRRIEISPALKIEEIALHDSLLIITAVSAANDYLLHIHNAFTGKHLNSFARQGRGPNEFIALSSAQLLEKRRELYFLDLNANIGIAYSLDSLLNKSIIPSHIVRFKERAYMMHLRIDSVHYLCGLIGHNWEGLEPSYLLYYIYNIANDTFNNRVSLPPLAGIDSVFNNHHLSAIFRTQPGWVSYNEYTGFIVQPYSHTDLLEVYDYNDAMRRVVRIHGPDRFFPYFEFAYPATSMADLMNPDKETWPVAKSTRDAIVFPTGVSRNAYFRARAYDKGFYVMYSGIPYPKEREPGIRISTIKHLFFFHYDGTPVRRYTFDIAHPQQYAVDTDRGVIYLLGLDGEIYAYEIPEYEK